jgi:hypothetical protein
MKSSTSYKTEQSSSGNVYQYIHLCVHQPTLYYNLNWKRRELFSDYNKIWKWNESHKSYKEEMNIMYFQIVLYFFVTMGVSDMENNSVVCMVQLSLWQITTFLWSFVHIHLLTRAWRLIVVCHTENKTHTILYLERNYITNAQNCYYLIITWITIWGN